MRIGVDIGGTFTDLACIDDAGRLHTAKTPSTPDDPARGVMRGLELLADEMGLGQRELLGRRTPRLSRWRRRTAIISDSHARAARATATAARHDAKARRSAWSPLAVFATSLNCATAASRTVTTFGSPYPSR